MDCSQRKPLCTTVHLKHAHFPPISGQLLQARVDVRQNTLRIVAIVAFGLRVVAFDEDCAPWHPFGNKDGGQPDSLSSLQCCGFRRCIRSVFLGCWFGKKASTPLRGLAHDRKVGITLSLSDFGCTAHQHRNHVLLRSIPVADKADPENVLCNLLIVISSQ